MSADARALDEWKAGVPAAQLARKYPPATLAALGEHLLQRNYEVFSNAKHPDHAALSDEIKTLMQAGNPGFVGPGGEISDGPAPAGLFGGGA